MKMKTACIGLAVLLAVGSPVIMAQTTAAPALLNYQGRLATPSGTPVPDGTYSIKFSLFDAATAGTEKWTQTIANVQVKNGTFAVVLNTNTANLFNGNLWLQIKVGADAALTPRQQLVTVPYALKSNLALTVPDGSLTAAKIANGTITADKLASGVGFALPFIGSTNANADAFVVSNTGIGSALVGNSISRFGAYGYSESNYGGYFFSNTGKGLYTNGLQSDGANIFNGTVGIGTAVPAGALDVTGTAYADYLIMRPQNAATGEGGEISLRGTGTQPDWFIDSYQNLFRIFNNNGGSVTSIPFCINSDGNVGFGTTTPFTKVDVVGQIQASSAVTAGNFGYVGGSGYSIYGKSSTQYAIRGEIDGAAHTNQWAGVSGKDLVSGNIGMLGTPFTGVAGQNRVSQGKGVFGITNGVNDGFGVYGDAGATTSYGVFSNGKAGGTTAWFNASDARYKTNVVTLQTALDAVLALRGVNFNWKRDAFQDKNFPEGRQIGFIAQEVEKVLPELVSTDAQGYKSVAYANVVPVLVEAVKAQQNQIALLRKDKEGQQRQIDALNAKVSKIDALEARFGELTQALVQLKAQRK